MELEINCREEAGNITNMWRLNDMLLNSHWVKEQVKEELKRYIYTNEDENTTYYNFRDAKKAALRGNTLIKKPNITPQRTGKRITKPTVSKRKEIKTRAEK